MAKKRVYKIIFHNHGERYEIYAETVTSSDIPGFVEVEALRFGERSKVLVDPSAERLQAEFEGVRRTLIPVHSVVRIDEVERLGPGKITEAKGSVTPFPGPGKPRE